MRGGNTDAHQFSSASGVSVEETALFLEDEQQIDEQEIEEVSAEENERLNIKTMAVIYLLLCAMVIPIIGMFLIIAAIGLCLLYIGEEAWNMNINLNTMKKA